jgi:hypothetical protein
MSCEQLNKKNEQKLEMKKKIAAGKAQERSFIAMCCSTILMMTIRTRKWKKDTQLSLQSQVQAGFI